jgi:hypothetical protein
MASKLFFQIILYKFQYRSMSYPAYGQHPQHYGQSSASMMGTPPQYPGQQSYPQQMWNPNV